MKIEDDWQIKERIHSYLKISAHRDYMDLLVLPKGARNFKITEVSKASHFLGKE